MGIILRFFPDDDLELEARVEAMVDGLAAIDGDGSTRLGQVLAEVTNLLRDEYPRLRLVPQSSLARINGDVVVYVFRDGRVAVG